MDFSVEKKELYAILIPEGKKLNSSNSADFKTEFIKLNYDGFRNILLDLKEVSFVDSSGLSAILVGNRLCNEARGTFVLVNVNPNVMQLLKISQLDSVLIILPSRQEAEDYIKMDELTRQISESSDPI